MPDMNPFAQPPGSGTPGAPPTVPGQGSQAKQQATSMPGAVGDMVQAMMSGYKQGQNALPGMSTGPSPDFPRAPSMGGPMPMGGAPMDLNQTPMGAMPNPSAPGGPIDIMNTPLPQGLPPGIMQPEPPVPFTGDFGAGAPGAGMPGMGLMNMLPGGGGGGMGLMDIFGGGQSNPNDLAMRGLFGGG